MKEIQETIAANRSRCPAQKSFLDELRELAHRSSSSAIPSPSSQARSWRSWAGQPFSATSLEVAPDGEITGFRMRIEQSKLHYRQGAPVHRLRDHCQRRQLQRPGHDPRQQGRLPLPAAPIRSKRTIRICRLLKNTKTFWKLSAVIFNPHCDQNWSTGSILDMLCKKVPSHHPIWTMGRQHLFTFLLPVFAPVQILPGSSEDGLTEWLPVLDIPSHMLRSNNILQGHIYNGVFSFFRRGKQNVTLAYRCAAVASNTQIFIIF